MSEAMTYTWKRGAPAGYAQMTAQQAACTLADVAERKGALTVHTLTDDVEEQGPAHPLGWAYTFDVGHGMRKLHEIESGDVIRHIAVRALVPEQRAPIRAFVVVRDDDGQRYEPIHIALRSADKRQQVLDDVRKDWQEFTDKMDELLQVCSLL